jgi:outer membrane protein assembly factor BamA
MRKTSLFTIIFILLCPIGAEADEKKLEANVNERYTVERIEYNGIDESRVSSALRDDAQKMAGEKYSEQSAKDIAKRLRRELKNYTVDFRVERGEKPDHVKVVFRLEKIPGHSIRADLPILVYHSKEGFSGDLEIPIETHHNVFTFGFINDADRLLERDAGYRFRYEHRKLGTDSIRLRINFETNHEKFNPATETALAQRPDIPGIYRSRQDLAPSLTLHPTKGLSLSAGVSLQRLQFQYPSIHTLTAYSGIADIQFNPSLGLLADYNQDFNIAYSLRTATRILDSDLVYSRHLFTADYMLSNGRHLFGAHFIGGNITGTAPLFERFSFGNSATLRGWNKFDVAPVGGSSAAHGSLEYRYRHFQVFYDVGAVWDYAQASKVRHGFGFGWASRHLFASLAFPVRLNDVAPVFMIGFRD